MFKEESAYQTLPLKERLKFERYMLKSGFKGETINHILNSPVSQWKDLVIGTNTNVPINVYSLFQAAMDYKDTFVNEHFPQAVDTRFGYATFKNGDMSQQDALKEMLAKQGKRIAEEVSLMNVVEREASMLEQHPMHSHWSQMVIPIHLQVNMANNKELTAEEVAYISEIETRFGNTDMNQDKTNVHVEDSYMISKSDAARQIRFFNSLDFINSMADNTEYGKLPRYDSVFKAAKWIRANGMAEYNLNNSAFHGALNDMVNRQVRDEEYLFARVITSVLNTDEVQSPYGAFSTMEEVNELNKIIESNPSLAKLVTITETVLGYFVIVEAGFSLSSL